MIAKSPARVFVFRPVCLARPAYRIHLARLARPACRIHLARLACLVCQVCLVSRFA